MAKGKVRYQRGQILLLMHYLARNTFIETEVLNIKPFKKQGIIKSLHYE